MLGSPWGPAVTGSVSSVEPWCGARAAVGEISRALRRGPGSRARSPRPRRCPRRPIKGNRRRGHCHHAWGRGGLVCVGLRIAVRASVRWRVRDRLPSRLFEPGELRRLDRGQNRRDGRQCQGWGNPVPISSTSGRHRPRPRAIRKRHAGRRRLLNHRAGGAVAERPRRSRRSNRTNRERQRDPDAIRRVVTMPTAPFCPRKRCAIRLSDPLDAPKVRTVRRLLAMVNMFAPYWVVLVCTTIASQRTRSAHAEHREDHPCCRRAAPHLGRPRRRWPEPVSLSPSD